ncbi:MAG: FIST signal transduction protein [Verrucomicrobiota bacterium]
MKIEQSRWARAGGWQSGPPRGRHDANLVFLFGTGAVLNDQELLQTVRRAYPQAHLLGCSTAGEICGTSVTDDSLVVTAAAFAHARVHGACINVSGPADSQQAGAALMAALPRREPETQEPLAHVFVLSDGLHVNGSELVRGLTGAAPPGVTVTGGLAGDGAAFGRTRVLWQERCESQLIAAVGFYGRRLKVGFGSLGGWDPFGPERLVTRAAGNVLYELDGQSALALYRKYLGEHAAELPASGLLFPLSLRVAGNDGTPVVRTILSVNDADQSMTFAGDIPVGSHVRLMKANFDRLIDGATAAASTCHVVLGPTSAELAVLISCVGRRLVLKQRVEEEVEGVRDVLGPQTVLAGFYSYGEISPFVPGAKCELHNQTMTITTLAEC